MTDRKWTEKLMGAMEALSDAKKVGKIRAVGVSCHSLAALRATAENGWADVVMVRINYEGVNMDSSHKNVLSILSDLYESETGIVGMKVLGVGKFASVATKAIDYVFSLNLFHAVTIGMMDKMMLKENIQIMGK